MFEIKKEIKKGDYLYALVPEHPRATKNGYVLLHRVIIENSLGRLLKNNEVVHHKDENKKNNDISNLEILDWKDHCKLHAKVGRATKILSCYLCNKEFEREVRNIKGKGFCSRSCNAKWNRNFSTWKGKSKL